MPRRSPPCSGFTLIEVMVVVVIMAVVTVAVAVGVGNIRGASVQSESGKLAIAVRYLYNLSVLSGHNHRLVIDMDTATYWAEEQTSADPCESFLLPGDDDDANPRGKKDKTEANAPGPQNSGFQTTTSQLLAKHTLDKGLKLAGVMTSHQTQLQETGQAYVYFFPNGTTENALLYVEGDPEDVMTVEVLALQGTAKVHEDKVDWNSFGTKGG